MFTEKKPLKHSLFRGWLFEGDDKSSSKTLAEETDGSEVVAVHSRTAMLREESPKWTSPRRSRRSLATPGKPPMEALLEGSPLKNANGDHVEVFDLSGSQLNTNTPRRRSLRKSILSKHMDDPSEVGLSIDDINALSDKRQTRKRNNSQTSAMSEESVSSNTRSKAKALSVTQTEKPSTPTRNTRRKSMPAATQSKSKCIDENQTADSPARSTRRRTMHAQTSESPTSKKSKVRKFGRYHSFQGHLSSKNLL